MKRLISLILSLAMVISVIPVISFAAEETINNVATYGLKENPFVLSDDNKTIVYEMEDYPFEGSNYKIVSDEDASGGAAMTTRSYLLKEQYKYAVPGDLCQYRLWVKTDKPTAVKVYVRAKTTGNTVTKVAMSTNGAKTVVRSIYLENGEGEYSWGSADSYEIRPGDPSAINFLFYSKGYIHKEIIKSDLLYMPSGMGDEYQAITLGEDTTDYDNLRYPIPPFTPRKDRPRVYLNKETIKNVRNNLAHPENAPVYEEVLKNASTEPNAWDINSASKYIWANAFLWQLNGDKEAGQKAVDAVFKSFVSESTLSENREGNQAYNNRAYQNLVLAIVYDWCYDFLSDEEKLQMIGRMLYYASQQEYPYPPNVHGRANGHESESTIFVGQLPSAIAIYEDYPEMYNIVGGKIFEEYLSTRNFYFSIKNHSQGTHYNGRMGYESLFALLLETGVSKGLIVEGADDCLLDEIFALRPDSQTAPNGDENRSGVTRTGTQPTAVGMLIWGNLCKNPYLRDAFFMCHPTHNFSYTASGLNHVIWLLVNDPSIGRKSYKEYPNVIYRGEKSGVVYAHTSWEMGDEDYSDQMFVRLNLENVYADGHDHLDTGHFDIYYKGSLAIDSGHYATYGKPHHRHYYQRGIAHNIMLLYDPDEVVKHRGYDCANDGGQQYINPLQGSLEKLETESIICENLGVDYGDDMKNPSFVYMKGDLTKAYWEGKMESYTRSFVYLNFFDEVYPGALIVFDRMVSKKPELKKTWLLHTQQEPSIDHETGIAIADKTEEGDNGRIINQTLYPKKDNVVIEKIGGEGFEYWVDGVNYRNADGAMIHPEENKDYGMWRLEISPKERTATDCLLNVLHVTEANDEIVPLEAELIEAGNFLGAKIKDRVAFFNTNYGRSSEDITFNLTGDEEYEILFTDVSSGQWIIYKDGKEYDRQIATENGGDFKFKGTKGEYTVKKNNRSPLTFTRDMNYRNYLTPIDDYDYFEINGLWFDFEYFKEDGKVFANVEKITKAAKSNATITEDNIIIKGNVKDIEVPKNSDSLRFKDGIWYIDITALESIINLKFTNPVANVYAAKGGLAGVKFEYLKEDGYAHIISATTADENYDYAYPVEFTVDAGERTLWQTDIIGNFIVYEFDQEYDINSVDIIWSQKGRGHFMKLETSLDGVNWEVVYDDVTEDSPSTTEYFTTQFKESKAKFVRITGSGNTQGSAWFGMYSLRFPVNIEYDATYGDGEEEIEEDVFTDEDETLGEEDDDDDDE